MTKIRGVYVGGDERKKECKECFFSFFSTSFSIIFLKRDKKGGVCESGDEKELEKNREYFFSVLFSYDRLCIYTHALQYQCDLNLNCYKQYKEGISHDSNTLWESNRSISEYKINQDQ